MTWHLYIIPAVGTGTREDPRTAKYMRALRDEGVVYTLLDFGLEPVFLVAADVTDAQHTTLSSQSDVTTIPDDLDNNLTQGQIDFLEDRLEPLNVPTHWITTSLTVRTTLRGIIGLFQFAQRYNGLHGLRLFRGQMNLNTTMSQLTQAERNRLEETADSLSLDSSAVTGSTTIRQLLNIMGQQFIQTSIPMGGITI